MDEADLADVIRGAQQGDPAAFDRLVDAYAHRLAGFAYRLTGSRQDAEDVAQEVFLRVVRTIGGYQHDGRFEAWIFRIAANLLRDRLRRTARVRAAAGAAAASGESDAAANLEDVPDSQPAADAGMRLSEDVDALNAALARLPAAEREVVMMRHYSAMSFKEIAELTSVPLGTALARGHRGLIRLRQLMGGAAAGRPLPHAEREEYRASRGA